MTPSSLSDALLSYVKTAHKHADELDTHALMNEFLLIAHDAFTDLANQPYSACSPHVCKWLAFVEELTKMQDCSS